MKAQFSWTVSKDKSHIDVLKFRAGRLSSQCKLQVRFPHNLLRIIQYNGDERQAQYTQR